MDIEIIRSAYRKLKSQVYYDNTNVLLRKKLALYESKKDIDDSLQEVADNIGNVNYWEPLLTKIGSYKLVKSFEHVKKTDGVISNKNIEAEYSVSRINHFINCPIELHIIAAIWTFEIGYQLEPLMAVSPFGNKLDIYKTNDRFELAKGLKSYKPYFKQYQNWRDGAVQEAKELVNKNKNALVIGLDIKDFYHSVRLDFDKIHSQIFSHEIPDNLKPICNILVEIHQRYTELIGIEKNRTILPIGLISSGVLANFYLDPLDRLISNKLKPDFYGRYVDDIIIVTSCPEEQNTSSSEVIAEQYLEEPGIFKYDDGEKLYRFNYKGYEDTTIQTDKLSILHFSAKEPTALLDKFLAEIQRNSSEYRLLPEDEVIEYDFDQAAYNLNYSGTGNKLRDIKEFGEDKFGISKYLAKKIFIALQSGHESDKEAISKILRFFKDRRAIELNSLWEKVFTFLLVNRDTKSIIRVVKQLTDSIDRIKTKDSAHFEIKEFYRQYLLTSLSLAFSLKPSALSDKEYFEKLSNSLSAGEHFHSSGIGRLVNAIRKANLLRHTHVVHPLRNYVDNGKKSKKDDLIDYSNYFKFSSQKHSISNEMYRYSPRFVHFHEICLFHIINRISTSRSDFYSSGLNFTKTPNSSHNDYLDEAVEDFYKLNYSKTSEPIDRNDPEFKKVKSSLFKLDPSKEKNNHIKELEVNSVTRKDELKVAIANIKIDEEVFSHPYLRSPRIKPLRRKNFNYLLNQAEKEDVDLLVLPEVSVPVTWFKWVSDYSLKKQRGLVFGLEHWVVDNKAYNFIVTLMPFTTEDGYNSLIINIRLKNHYSPSEAELLRGYGYVIPEIKTSSYDLFKWRGCHFTVFNCYELSNIEHRTKFRSKVDLLVASEFNSDINYFSNIVESSARDIHCYIAQSNDSKYGDSRITQPSKTVQKDLLKVKGGKNPSILVDTLNFSALREFQLKEYTLQKELGDFKPTPPDFDKKSVRDRMNK